jgi:hypothetical protein
MDHPIAESCIDGAFHGRIGAPVGVGVMNQGVLGLPEELVRLPSQHLSGRRVHECGESLSVQAVDTLTRRLQDQVSFPPQLFESLLRSTSLRQVAQRFAPLAACGSMESLFVTMVFFERVETEADSER